MPSWSTSCIIKLMTLWNYICFIYNNTVTKCKNIYFYLQNYIEGYHDIWLFIPGHTFPLSLSNLDNIIQTDWLYDNFDNTLNICTNKNEEVNCKLSWLSAKIYITDSNNPEIKFEYELDDFIEKFSINTISDIPPSLYLIFMSWCIYTKHWFKLNDDVEFHIIDDMGDQIVLNLYDHNTSLFIKRNKLYVVIHTNDSINDNIGTINNIIELPLENMPLKDEQIKKDE